MRTGTGWHGLARGFFATALLTCASAWAQAKPEERASLNADYKDPLRMPYYTGSILPTPQKATYKSVFFPLENAGILLGEGLKSDGPCVRELRERIERYGGKVRVVPSQAAACDTLIILGKHAAAEPFLKAHPIPEREQSYVMVTDQAGDKRTVVLAGHDRLGLLWAITSFNQLVHEKGGACCVRAADVADYPYAANRGFIDSHWPEGIPYCIAFKINKPVFQTALCDYSITDRQERYRSWRTPPSDAVKQHLRQMGERFSALGIEWYAGVNPYYTDWENKMLISKEADYQALLAKAAAAAEAGGNFCLKFDDYHFPLKPEDQKRFGTVKNADIYLLNRLHRDLRTRYPESKILFCPPFYFGPTSKAPYPESRDEYLSALGMEVPKDIGIFWTGPSVKSGHVSPEMVQWITERIRRKPVYWQNAIGTAHMHFAHYVTDPLPVLRDWFYQGFLHDIDTYMFNCQMPGSAAAAASIADFCWNPGAFDPERSITEAAGKLVGPGMYPGLKELNQAISYFDKFWLKRTPAAARLLPEMEKKLAVVNAAWEKTKQENIAAVRYWTQMERYVSQVNGFVAGLKRMPNLDTYREQAGESEEHAKKEVGLDPQKETFLSAYDFVGGVGPEKYKLNCEARLATWIYGTQTANPRMSGRFEVEPFPPEGDYELTLCAQDDDRDAPCRIHILVNDTVIFEGPNPAKRNGWSRHALKIPAKALLQYNTLLIENIEPSAFVGGVDSPWFMLNYAVVRKAK